MLAKVTDGRVKYSDFNDYALIGKTGYQQDIIEAVQQAALWYFTNPNGEHHPIFDFDNVREVDLKKTMEE